VPDVETSLESLRDDFNPNSVQVKAEPPTDNPTPK